MLKYLAAFVVFALPIVGVVKYLETLEPRQEQASSETKSVNQNAQKISLKTPKNSSAAQPVTGRKARIKMDDRGHFYVDARMNGRKVPVLIDTGATSVAINRSTARRMGINLSASDFIHRVNTANGVTKAATATIKRIEIGRVRVSNVRAMVLEDKSLKGTLLGMSFLGELKSFGVKNRELILEQ